jgi:mannose-6-phosphate isomerase-like protein (cupin superfamily)
VRDDRSCHSRRRRRRAGIAGAQNALARIEGCGQREKLLDVCHPGLSGREVTPAHSHPNGEEVIYIMTGSGRVLVAGEVRQVSAGTAVLFPQGAVHMLHNTGSEEMKVVCFFAPATGLDNYRLHEGVDFPD